MAHPVDNAVHRRGSLRGDQAASCPNLIEAVDERLANILHRPHGKVSPKQTLLGALDAADNQGAARDAVGASLIGGLSDPHRQVAYVTPAHQHRVLDAVEGGTPRDDLLLRHGHEGARVGRRRLGDDRGDRRRHGGAPDIDWATVGAGDEDAAPIVERPVRRSDGRANGGNRRDTRSPAAITPAASAPANASRWSPNANIIQIRCIATIEVACRRRRGRSRCLN